MATMMPISLQHLSKKTTTKVFSVILQTMMIQDTNNGSTSSATAEDDDDVTVQTSNSNSTTQAWTSYNIKLLLTSKRDTSDSALQHAMLTILTAID
jgi:hypothetical protein